MVVVAKLSVERRHCLTCGKALVVEAIVECGESDEPTGGSEAPVEMRENGDDCHRVGRNPMCANVELLTSTSASTNHCAEELNAGQFERVAIYAFINHC
jgi:hypothetical protein